MKYTYAYVQKTSASPRRKLAKAEQFRDMHIHIYSALIMPKLVQYMIRAEAREPAQKPEEDRFSYNTVTRMAQLARMLYDFSAQGESDVEYFRQHVLINV